VDTGKYPQYFLNKASPVSPRTTLYHELYGAYCMGRNKIVAIAVSLSMLLSMIGAESSRVHASTADSAADQGLGLGNKGTRTKARPLIERGLAHAGEYRHGHSPSQLLAAFRLLQDAGRLAEAGHDPLLLSSALGSMAGLYEEEGRLDEALQLSRQAVFAAQEAGEPRLLYQWHWQTGRLLQKMGERDGALASYRLAIAESRAIRELATGDCRGAGIPSVRPDSSLYEEAVDLMLQRAAALHRRPELRTAALREARETIELLKASELRDYFQDDCLASLQAKRTDIDAIDPKTAVIYPIILPDRIEMLTTIGGVMNSYRIKEPAQAISAEINRFRIRLETRTSAEYLPLAQHLYDQLIRPMEPALTAAGVDTLVFVPAGIFRTMPFAALHDGQGFLVARYATAVTPGLDLTEPRPIDRRRVTGLAVGLTKGVQGFAPLPSVDRELHTFHAIFGGRELLNQEFTVAALEKTLRQEPVGIIHIASHGQFGADLASTYLLAYDRKLTMDRLNEFVGMFRFRQEPLELLTLSACQTAAGDDRAALGLAGVAVGAGARSAVATLWYINDQASSTLIDEFYRRLQVAGTTKARALQQAKVALMQDRRYRHPAYWAPFLLINNWL
jgi:CHAT domain-containing protein